MELAKKFNIQTTKYSYEELESKAEISITIFNEDGFLNCVLFTPAS